MLRGKEHLLLQNFQHDRDCNTGFEGTDPSSTQSGLLISIVPPQHAKIHFVRLQKLFALSFKGESGKQELMFTVKKKLVQNELLFVCALCFIIENKNTHRDNS